jgi:monoamine oxidase
MPAEGPPSPASAPPTPPELLRTASAGLDGRSGERKKVIVIGAGMAGLASAFELARQGHEPLVLEAQNRVGGRVLTLRDFPGDLYGEAGGMRIPRVHELTLEYCRMLGLELRPIRMECPQAPVYLAGRRMTLADVKRDPSLVPFALAEHERDRSWSELWDEATRDVRERYERDGAAALEAIAQEYGGHSIQAFLRERGFSEGAIELYGLMSFREGNMSASVVEHLREIVGRAFEDMQEVAGGMDRLPNAFLHHLRRHVRLGAHVFAVDQREDGVTVRFRTPSGTAEASGDYCICTLPFGVLRHVDFRPPLSIGKYRAIRELNYNPSTKVLLQVRSRFWEREGVVGGATATDLPIRRMVYRPIRRPTTIRAASSSRAIRGGRTPPGGGPSVRRSASSWRSRTWRRSGLRSATSARAARHTRGTATRTRLGHSRFSRPARRRFCTATSCGRRAACISPVSTARCGTRGSRAPSSPVCAPRGRSTRRPPRGHDAPAASPPSRLTSWSSRSLPCCRSSYRSS